MKDKNSSLLVIGGPDSGKSTYRAQLYYRVEHGDGELQLSKSMGNMAGLEADINRLVRGLQPMHTNLDSYSEATFSITDRQGNVTALAFADYGGEQIGQIGRTNVIKNDWIERAKSSSAWLFFLRIDHLRPTKSFMTQPVEATISANKEEEPLTQYESYQCDAIEVLQRLLFVRGNSRRYKLGAPKIGIFLSCWDEVGEAPENQQIINVLQKRAPLFKQFVTSNWETGRYQFWGLSSTERKLPEANPDIEFARKGPEKVGYLINESGDKIDDLTVPIVWLMNDK